METLTLIGLIVGILVSVIALLEKFFHVFSKRDTSRKAFEEAFSTWKESAFSYIPKSDELKRFVGHVLKNSLDDQRNTFALLCALQHGDKSLHYLIGKNRKNGTAIPFVFDFVTGRGIRVGWRAEYALSQLNRAGVSAFINGLPENSMTRDDMAVSVRRILDGGVEDFVVEQLAGESQKLRSYANEVLRQIRPPVAPKPKL
jgi:hypothetical protein